MQVIFILLVQGWEKIEVNVIGSRETDTFTGYARSLHLQICFTGVKGLALESKSLSLDFNSVAS